MRKQLILFLCLFVATAMAQKNVRVTVTNNGSTDKVNEPVVLGLKDIGVEVRSALVMYDGKEIPSQLDDTDRNGCFDELCFLVDIKHKENKTYNITLSNQGQPRTYGPKVFAELMLRDNKVKAKNKQSLYLSELTVNRGVNPYQSVHHHGVAFENELLCMRIYFDHRQTVDLYGKNHKGLELKETQFYTDAEQKAAGYGDDILWVGSSYGLGALRGWDGVKQTMVSDVEKRSQRIISNGPIRTIVEIEDKGWSPQPGLAPVDMKIYYILYAGRRDCDVKVLFNRNKADYRFATGLVNVGGNSVEYTDHKGLRGCWGTAWPVAMKDSANHKRETVGLGIFVPQRYLVSEKPASEDEYTFVVKPDDNALSYCITYTSDNEDFGFHNQKDWFAFLEEWKKDCKQPLTVKVQY